MTPATFQRHIYQELKLLTEQIVQKHPNSKIDIQSEPPEPLTEEEKTFIRNKFRYLLDTSSVQFYDKVIKTNVVRPDLVIQKQHEDRTSVIILDSKHYNSKSKQSSLPIGQQILINSSITTRNEVSIYEVVKLYRDMHAFKTRTGIAPIGGLILSPSTILSYTAKMLVKDLNLLVFKVTRRKGSMETVKKSLTQLILDK